MIFPSEKKLACKGLLSEMSFATNWSFCSGLNVLNPAVGQIPMQMDELALF